MTPPEVATILQALPEFVGRYLDLVEAADGDPGAAATFCELAEFVAVTISDVESAPGVLARCLSAIEQVARESDDADELVGWAFLESLAPEDLAHLEPWLGPYTLGLADPPEANSAKRHAP